MKTEQLHITISSNALVTIYKLKKIFSTTDKTVISRALGLFNFLASEINNGSDLFIERRDGEQFSLEKWFEFEPRILRLVKNEDRP